MRLYDKNEMVKAGCNDCKGCSDCCRGMGDTILLDPLDCVRLSEGFHKSFEELLETTIALHVEDGLILPHMQMTDANGQCVCLNEEGRCSIHAFRPGLCRLFPLGRNYEVGKLKYFLLEDCPAKNKTKVKIEKWLQVPELSKYETYLTDWHYLLKDFREKATELQSAQGEEADVAQETLKKLNMLLLQVFYISPYNAGVDFYGQFHERLERVRSMF